MPPFLEIVCMPLFKFVSNLISGLDCQCIKLGSDEFSLNLKPGDKLFTSIKTFPELKI